MSRILVFGDSIVWGADDTKYGGWVNRFKIWFKTTGKFNEVFNLGNSGEISAQLLKRIENESKARIKPEYKEKDIIIIQAGQNDSLFIHSKNNLRVSTKDFEDNLQELINIAQKFSSKIVFLGLTPVEEAKVSPIPWNADKSYKNEYIQEYNQIVKRVCEENKIHFIEVFDDWLKMDYKKLLEDGLHPNSAGHEKIFKTIKDFLIKNKII
jgi:lysophospholipase L1-like esterase